jgi:hypothetical protein
MQRILFTVHSWGGYGVLRVYFFPHRLVVGD